MSRPYSPAAVAARVRATMALDLLEALDVRELSEEQRQALAAACTGLDRLKTSLGATRSQIARSA